MLSSLVQLLAPSTAYRCLQRYQPVWQILCLVGLGTGLMGGLYFVPPDYQQGDVYRILFIHVPCAVFSLGLYMLMAFSAVCYLVWKIRLFDLLAKVTAPIGALFTICALITGSIWGKPTWGTWWIWDARLTSELILLFLYWGIMALREAFTDTAQAARMSAILAVLGVVNIPIIHYSVTWWHTLHQGATILQWHAPAIHSSMLYPLLFMLLGTAAFAAWLITLRLRYELLFQHRRADWVQMIERRATSTTTFITGLPLGVGSSYPFTTPARFFSMGGLGGFVWTAYGVVLGLWFAMLWIAQKKLTRLQCQLAARPLASPVVSPVAEKKLMRQSVCEKV